MKTAIRAATLAAFLFAGCLPIFAGDYATLNFIGFSRDGRYLAFEEYGTQDGSGFPYSSYYFIDVANNKYAAPPVTVRIDDERFEEPAARRRAATKAGPTLARLKIVKGNRGRLLVSRLITDLSNDVGSGDPLKVHFAEEIGSLYHKGDYELVLTPTKVVTKECEIFELDTYTLELKLNDLEGKASRILQKDSTLPKGRGCALGYRIQDIYVIEDQVAVFVSVFLPGFEGSDMRFIAITGRFR